MHFLVHSNCNISVILGHEFVMDDLIIERLSCEIFCLMYTRFIMLIQIITSQSMPIPVLIYVIY